MEAQRARAREKANADAAKYVGITVSPNVLELHAFMTAEYVRDRCDNVFPEFLDNSTHSMKFKHDPSSGEYMPSGLAATLKFS